MTAVVNEIHHRSHQRGATSVAPRCRPLNRKFAPLRGCAPPRLGSQAPCQAWLSGHSPFAHWVEASLSLPCLTSGLRPPRLRLAGPSLRSRNRPPGRSCDAYASHSLSSFPRRPLRGRLGPRLVALRIASLAGQPIRLTGGRLRERSRRLRLRAGAPHQTSSRNSLCSQLRDSAGGSRGFAPNDKQSPATGPFSLRSQNRAGRVRLLIVGSPFFFRANGIKLFPGTHREEHLGSWN